MRTPLLRQSGQTLIEIVIAIGAVALVVTALVSAVSASLRFSESSRMRSRAVKLAQESMEITRALRDTTSWTSFSAYASGNGNWCLDSTNTWSAADASGTCPISSGNPIWRSVHFTWNDPVMEVTTNVSWGEHQSVSTVTLKTYFTQWK